jgi:hypothetical protein
MTVPPSPASEWHLSETYKGLLTLAVECLKMLALVNGGAAVAVLTYLGNLTQRPGSVAYSPDIKHALLWFGIVEDCYQPSLPLLSHISRNSDYTMRR